MDSEIDDDDEDYSDYGESPNESARKLESLPANNSSFNAKNSSKQNQLLST